MICEDEKTRQHLISLMSGREDVSGRCELDNISTSDDRKAYKRKVDFVNPRDIDSELTVKEYLIFYAMVSENYHEGTVAELTKVFHELHKQEIMNKKVNELVQQEQVMVRCVAAHLKNVKLLISKNLLECKMEEKREILEFLEKYFVKNSCYCILFEDNIEITKNVIDNVIQI